MATPLKYEIASANANELKTKLTTVLAQDIKKPYVKTSWNNNEITIEIDKMGKSEIKLMLSDAQGNCQIQETKRNISFMHKPFVGEVEKIMDDVLVNKLGAIKA